MKNNYPSPFIVLIFILQWCLLSGSLHAQLSKDDFLAEANRANELRGTDLEASFRLADSLLTAAEEEGWLQGVIHAKSIIAQYYRTKGQYEIAKSNYKELNALIEDNYGDLLPDYLNHTYQQHIVSYYDLGIIHYRQGEHDSTLFHLDISDSLNQKARQVIKPTTFQKNQLNAKSLRAAIYYSLGQLQKAAEVMEESAVLNLQLDRLENTAIAYNNLGMIYQNTGEVTKAIKALQQAIVIADSANLSSIMVGAVGQLGRQFYSMKYHDEALHHSKRAYKLSKEMDLRFETASLASDIGDSYRALGMLDSAQWYYQTSLDLHQALDSKDWVAYMMEGMARVSILREDYDAAIDYATIGLEIAEENDYKEELLILNVVLAECLLEKRKIAMADEVVNQLLVMVGETDNLQHQQEVYDIAQQVAIAKGDARQAYNYLLKFNQLNDSIYSEEKALELATANYEYELEKETSRLQAEQERQELLFQEQQNRDRLIKGSLFGATVLVAIIAILALRAYRIKQKTNSVLAEKNIKLKELRASEKLYSEEALAAKDRELATLAMASHEKTTLLNKLQETVGNIESQIDNQLKTNLKEIKKSIEVSSSLDKSWDSFLHRFEDVHPRFFNTLKTANPNLTMEDLKLSAYLKIGMSNKEIANVTHLTPGSVKTKVHRLKKKLQLGPEDNIRDMMMVDT